MKVSIIIPCYNESTTIRKIVEQVSSSTIIEKEIIVIDDGSTDETKKILNDLKHLIDHTVSTDQNNGKGSAISLGIKYATGEIILIQDADLEYNPKDYSKLIEPIIQAKADVVYGSRFLNSESVENFSFKQKFANKVLTQLSNYWTGLNLTDMETCYKVFRSELVQSMNFSEKRFGIEAELTAKLSKVPGIQFQEVPISYSGRSYDEGKKIGWLDGLSAIRCILWYNILKK